MGLEIVLNGYFGERYGLKDTGTDNEELHVEHVCEVELRRPTIFVNSFGAEVRHRSTF